MQLSGREMFFFNPDLAANDLMDDGDEAFDSYQREEDEDDSEVKVIMQSVVYLLFNLSDIAWTSLLYSSHIQSGFT